MKKQDYIQPEIDKVEIDNEISVVLMSVIDPGPDSGDPLVLPPAPEQG